MTHSNNNVCYVFIAELIDYQRRLILTEYYKFTGFHTKEWLSQDTDDIPGLFPHHLDPGAITIRTTPSSSSGGKRMRNSSNRSPDEARWVCPTCGKRYKYSRGLAMHRRLECGKEPMFHCPFCPQKCHQKGNMVIHIKKKHPTQYEEQSQAVVQAHVKAQHVQSD